MTAKRPVRVVLADDSALVRRGVREALEVQGGVEVVAEAADAPGALAAVERHLPGVLLLGLDLPGDAAFDLAATARKRWRLGVVGLAARVTPHVSTRASAAGVQPVLEKPTAWDARRAAELRHLVEAAADARDTPAPQLAPDAHRRPFEPGRPPRLLGVGASTGGPGVLVQLLAALPERVHVPVLVVQHTDEGGVAPLVEWLAASTGRVVRVAEAGASLTPGVVLLAPGGRHLLLGPPGTARLALASSPSSHVPSVDELFLSLAAFAGPAAGGVILSGMGDDGSRGLKALRDAGGATWVQDPASASAPGMPQAALAAHAAPHGTALPQLLELFKTLRVGEPVVAPA